MATSSDEQEGALIALLRHLKSSGYRFEAVTPATHGRVLARPSTRPVTVRDILGWNRPFNAHEADPPVLALLDKAFALTRSPEGLRSNVRVASLGADLFLHSSFPTEDVDAVFFGPDTYRFARFIADEVGGVRPPARIVDMGTGSGAGGMVCGRLWPDSAVTLVDVNPRALSFARVNAIAAGLEVEMQQADRIPRGSDLIVANPPYMIDPQQRSYRDGGDLLGGALAVDWVEQALDALAPGGSMLLYTGVAMVDGRSPALDAIQRLCKRRAAHCSFREIDPDVFGEELEQPAYDEVERIAAVGGVVRLG